MVENNQKTTNVLQFIKLLICTVICLIIVSCEKQPNTSQKLAGNASIPKELSSQSIPFKLNSLDFSAFKLEQSSYIPFEKVQDYYDTGIDFPMELVNKVGMSLYLNDVRTLMLQQNDSSLQIEMSEFTIVKRTQYDSTIEYEEKCFYDDLENKSYIIYRFDGDLDGKDEIYMFEDLINTDAGIMQLFILEPNETGEYLFSARIFFDSRKFIAVVKYQGEYFFLFNHEDFATNTTMSVEIARVVKRDNDYKSKNWLLSEILESVYISRENKSVQYSLLYQNEQSNLTDEVNEYIGRIETDLVASNARTYGIFFGYEQPENNGQNSFRSIYSADVDNDGTADLFSRCFLGQDDFLNVKWHSRVPKDEHEEQTETTPPFSPQTPNGYFLKQMWFLPVKGKIVTFTLYQKNGALRFVLDAFVYENGVEQHLAVYKIQFTPEVCFSPYWDSVPIENNPKSLIDDAEKQKAFGMLSEENYQTLVSKYAVPIEKIEYNSDNFPQKLVSDMQDGLLNFTLDKKCSDLQNGIEMLDRQAFLTETEAYFDEETWEYASYRHFDCYRADFDDDGKKEYLVFLSDGSGGYGDFYIYKMIDGKLVDISESDILLEGYNSLIRYDGKFYFVLQTYDYNTKHSDGITLFRIFPDGHDLELYINIQNDRYDTIQLYKAPDFEKICDYIEQVSHELISSEEQHHEEYVGDEEIELTIEERSRLFSIGNEKTYYKVDYNNDNVFEYFSKQLIYPSSSHQRLFLSYSFFELGESVKSFAPNFDEIDEVAILYQLWYKKIDGKTYSFRLFNYGTEYVINSFLVQGDTMHQIATYILIPRNSISIYEQNTQDFE